MASCSRSCDTKNSNPLIRLFFFKWCWCNSGLHRKGESESKHDVPAAYSLVGVIDSAFGVASQG